MTRGLKVIIPLQMNTHATSNIGLIRKVNQDRYLIRDIDDNSCLIVVSDGMGGESGGELASAMVVDSLARFTLNGKEITAQLAKQAQTISESILTKAEADPELLGMGATIVAALIRDNKAYWVNLGDSRLYLLRNNNLKQISRDHSFVQDFIDAGEMTLEEARKHPMSHVMDQCAGTPEAEPDTGVLDLEIGDELLLCSDGLHGFVDDATIAKALTRSSSPEDASFELIREALDAGGRDNVTVALLFHQS